VQAYALRGVIQKSWKFAGAFVLAAVAAGGIAWTFGPANSLAPGPSSANVNSPVAATNSTATVVLRSRSGLMSVKLSCATRRLACARLTDLRRSRFDRCLQIWGGPERALIRLGSTRPIVVTRANSCGIVRWAKLQKLLAH